MGLDFFELHSLFEVLSLIGSLGCTAVEIARSTLDDFEETSHWIDFGFSVVFAVEFVYRAARWFWDLKKDVLEFLKSHFVDIVILVLFWVDSIVWFRGTPQLIRLSCIRPLRLLVAPHRISWLQDFGIVTDTMRGSGALLFTTGGILLFSIIFFGLLTIQIFQNSLSRYCVSVVNGKEMIPRTGCKKTDQPYANSDCPKGFICVLDETEHPSIPGFDNLASALVLMYQCISNEVYGGQILTPLSESEPDFRPVLWIFFVMVQIIANFIVQSLFVAILVSSYDTVRCNEREGGLFSIHHHRNDYNSESTTSTTQHSQNTLRMQTLSHLFTRNRFTSPKPAILQSTAVINTSNSWMLASTTPTPSSVAAVPRSFSPQPPSPSPQPQHPSSSSVSISYTCRKISKNRWFVSFIMSSLVLNTIATTVNYDGIPSWYANITGYIQGAFAIIYSIELLLKLVAYRHRYFFSLERNYEIFCVAISWMAACSRLGLLSLPFLDAFLTFRLIRVVRGVNRVWQFAVVLGRSAWVSSNMIVVYSVVASAYCLLGHQIFKVEATEENRSTFTTYSTGMLSLFQVMGGFGWIEIMYGALEGGPQDSLQLIGSREFYVVFTVLFFISFHIFSHLIIINLLIAVILENYGLSETEAKAVGDKMKQIARVVAAGRTMIPGVRVGTMHAEEKNKAVVVGMLKNNINNNNNNKIANKNNDKKDFQPVKDEFIKFRTGVVKWVQSFSFCREQFERYQRLVAPLQSRVFDNFIYIAIVINCILLATQGPPSNSYPVLSKNLSDAIDLICLVVFCIEFLLRIGWNGPAAYFSNGWFLMDFAILVSSIVEKASSAGRIGRVFRLLRCLRPLRVLNKNVSMKIVVNGLLSSFESVIFMILLFLFINVLFAVLGTELFRNKLYKCTYPDVEGIEDCVGTYLFPLNSPDGLPKDNTIITAFSYSPSSTESTNSIAGSGKFLMPRAWVKPLCNFDYVSTSLLTLMRVATAMWYQTLHALADITGEGKQPKFNNNPFNNWFCIIFLAYSITAVINLFVAVVVEYFKASAQNTILNKKQKRWVATKHLIKESSIKQNNRPKNRFRALLYDMVLSKRFESLISTVVVANTAFLAITHANEPQHIIDIVDWLLRVVLFIFAVEMLIKLCAFGVKGYFLVGWYRLEAFLVIASAIALGLQGIYPILIKAARILSVMRVLRALQSFKTLRKLVQNAVTGLPSLLTIVLIVILLLWVYAVLGVSLFGDIKDGFILGQGASFDHFFAAMLTLFEIMTGDIWDILMDDCRNKPPFCTPDKVLASGVVVYTDCGLDLAPLFFVSFIVIGTFVLTNLFIAVVVENFLFTFEDIEPYITQDDIDRFVTVWDRWDPLQSGDLHVCYLRSLLDELGSPFVNGIAIYRRRFYLHVRFELMIIATEKDKIGIKKPKRDQVVPIAIDENEQTITKGLSHYHLENSNYTFSRMDLIMTMLYWNVTDDCFTYTELENRMVIASRVNSLFGSSVIEGLLAAYLERRRQKKLKLEAPLIALDRLRKMRTSAQSAIAASKIKNMWKMPAVAATPASAKELVMFKYPNAFGITPTSNNPGRIESLDSAVSIIAASNKTQGLPIGSRVLQYNAAMTRIKSDIAITSSGRE